MQRPKVICFDLGGVLVKICRTLTEACERAGLPLRDATWLQDEINVAARREVMLEYQAGRLTTERYFAEMCQRLGHRYTQHEVMRLHDAWLIEEYQGAHELVSELVRMPSVTAVCLSNTNERHWNALVLEGSLDNGSASIRYPSVMALERRFASHLLRSNKPDTAIYHAFCEQLAAAPRDILFFDDTVANVEAARSLGWQAELIDHSGDTVEQMRRHLKRRGI